MKIEVGKTYPSKNGETVKIVYRLNLDPRCNYPVYVGVKVKKNWESLITDTLFKEDGTPTYMNTEYTLQAPQTLPEIPWDQLPPWIHWWAADNSGRQYYYAEKPFYRNGMWLLAAISRSSSVWGIPEEYRLPYTGLPEDSLRKRPETPGKKG